MSTVDEILASGRYTDRRGRVWEKRIRWSTSSGRRMWSHLYRLEPLLGGPVYQLIDESQMRLLIERDQHRDVCPRVGVCRNHPVPRVTFCDVGGFDVWGAGELTRAEFARPCIATLAEAMDAARALAVGE